MSGIWDAIKGRIAALARQQIDLAFRIARNVCPILVVKFGGASYALVTRCDDVKEVLLLPNVFDVTYAPKMEVILTGDNFFLGMRDEEAHTRNKTLMRLAGPRADAMTKAKPEAEAFAEEIVAGAAGRLDAARQLTQAVTTKFFCNYFGIYGPSPEAVSEDSRVLFNFLFADLADDPAVRAKAEPVAAAMRGYVEAAIAERKQNRGRRDDMLERCLQLQDIGVAGASDREIRNNFIGLIVGAVPQAPMLIPAALDVLLDRPEQLAAACDAARANDDERVAAFVFEAARFAPPSPGLFRNCISDHRVAAGTWRARTIPAGARVFAATRSAMFDGRRVPDPREFRPGRPAEAYILFGYGMHECFGLYINQTMIPAICKAVLKRPNLRRAAGSDGQLQMDGIFPKSLVVEHD